MTPQPDKEPSYQTAWEAFTGLFDPRRKGKPPYNREPEKDPDEDEDAKKKLAAES